MVRRLSSDAGLMIFLFLWLTGCEPIVIDAVLVDESDLDTNKETDTESDTGSEDTTPARDEVLARVIAPPDFAATPLRADVAFFRPGEFPPRPPIGWGSSVEAPAIDGSANHENPYLIYSSQGGLTGKYNVQIILYVEGGALDSSVGWKPRPTPGVDWIANCDETVDLGPGSGIQECGFAPLRISQ